MQPRMVLCSAQTVRGFASGWYPSSPWLQKLSPAQSFETSLAAAFSSSVHQQITDSLYTGFAFMVRILTFHLRLPELHLSCA